MAARACAVFQIVLFFALSLPVDAQEGHVGSGHDKWHQSFYNTLQRPDGKGSCCNLTDCRPTSGPSLDGHYEVKVNGVWISVPQTTIIRRSAPEILLRNRKSFCQHLWLLECAGRPEAMEGGKVIGSKFALFRLPWNFPAPLEEESLPYRHALLNRRGVVFVPAVSWCPVNAKPDETVQRCGTFAVVPISLEQLTIAKELSLNSDVTRLGPC